jgi:three-Cys-motif partner protein
MSTQSAIKNYSYVDAFAGAGRLISKRTGEFVPGSPLNALGVKTPFTEYHLIDLDRGRVSALREEVGPRTDVFIYNEDANKVLLETVFPRCRFEGFNRALCLLDPYGLNVNWDVLQTAGHMGSIEIFYNFMIMDANMNVLWRNPDKVDPVQAERMDKVWGDRTWRQAAYVGRPTLWGTTVDEKAPNRDVAEAFRARLEKVAGFRFVPDPVPMRNSRGATIYYLFFASPNRTGARIVEEIFNAYRTRGMI